jgi:hypothetical protein
MGPNGCEVAEADPAVFVAVTRERSVAFTSLDVV